MKSIISNSDTYKLVKKSISDLSSRSESMWKWLTQNPDKNSGKAQFKKNFQDIHLEMAFLRMKDILPYSYMFSKKRLYDIFNAQTVKPILDNMLSINEEPNMIKQFTHDFRTTEMARMMFELSTQYLKDLTNSKMVKDDVQRVSEHFKIQSENKLENETYANHGKSKERILTEKTEQELINEKNELIQKYHSLNDDDEIKKMQNRYEKLSLDQIKQNNLKLKLKKEQRKKIEKQIRRDKNELNEINECLTSIEDKYLEKISNIELKLELKFQHLNSFASSLNFLPEFLDYMLKNNFTIPEPNDGSTVIIEPYRKLNEEEKKRAKANYELILKNHDKIKWYGASTDTSIEELRKHPPLNKFQQSAIGGIIPTTYS